MLPLALALTGCDGTGVFDGDERRFQVNHHKVECVGVGLRLCLLVRESDRVDYTYMYDTPDGFVYEWGYVYEIIVEEREVSPVLADASSVRRILRQVVSKERVPPGTSFDIVLTAQDGRIRVVAEGRYRFYEETEFQCVAVRCEDLATVIENGGRVMYRFEHPVDATDPLHILEWQPCDPNLVCSQAC